MAQPFWKTVCQYLVKLKVLLPYDPTIPFLVMYSKGFFQTVMHDPLVDCEIDLRVTTNISYK